MNIFPKQSMYGIYPYIYHKKSTKCSKYAIHGWYGFCWKEINLSQSRGLTDSEVIQEIYNYTYDITTSTSLAATEVTINKTL